MTWNTKRKGKKRKTDWSRIYLQEYCLGKKRKTHGPSSYWPLDTDYVSFGLQMIESKWQQSEAQSIPHHKHSRLPKRADRQAFKSFWQATALRDTIQHEFLPFDETFTFEAQFRPQKLFKAWLIHLMMRPNKAYRHAPNVSQHRTCISRLLSVRCDGA